MTFDIGAARQFVYRNGALFERALFAWLFDGGSLAHLHQCIRCYKNPDGGYGHGLEHDVKAPHSNPLALEYLLGLMRHCEIPPGDLLNGCADWVEAQMEADGTLRNPPETRDYPLAPWWDKDGGQNQPDSITANLIRFDAATPSLVEKTKRWVMANLSLESIRANEWLFMAYHAHDFFFAIDDFPQLEAHRRATIDNIAACAATMPEEQCDSIFAFAPRPDSMIAKALPPGLLAGCLDHVATSQREDGGWRDQHDLPQWYPMTTINALLALRRYGRLT